MSIVTLQAVAKRFGNFVALQPTDLEIGDGEFLTLLGPSGCGKTTTLRIIAGFIEPSEGVVRFDGEDVTRLPPQKRAIGMVFQDYALFPHLSVAENIGFGLRERGTAKAKIKSRVGELLDLIRLPQIAERFPAEISGGQAQRVAFARAIASPPRVLLMDEPLGALDLKLREAMQIELRRLQRELAITTIYVTHDQGEAMNLSDRIAVMENGRVAQFGTAQEIYNRPRTRFVADFIGKINFLHGIVAGRDGALSVVRAGGVTLRAPATGSGEVTIAIRPEHVGFVNGHGAPPGDNLISGTVVTQMFNGNLTHVQVAVAGGEWTVEMRPGEAAVADGQAVQLHWRPEHSVALTE